jgi:ketosteroid isomerase-like protein
MSQENIEIVRQQVEAFNRRDFEACQALSTPDVELVTLRAALEGAAYRGPDAFARALGDFDGSWEDLRYEVQEIRPAGDRVVAIGHLRGRGRASGVTVDAPLAALFGLRAGKIAIMRAYTDVTEALEAVGPSD